MAANATELYAEMANAIIRFHHTRTVLSTASPQRKTVVEALPGQTFVWASPHHNLVATRPINAPWAIANVLHFFAGTEKAAPLRRYNPAQADRFLTGDLWIGAYGAIAMRQIANCIVDLSEDTNTRRAFVSMGEASPQDMNRPACWNNLHFLSVHGRLDLLVYQRSLNLPGVMPYDAMVLSNVLVHVASAVGMPVGNIRWTVGSLHAPAPFEIVAPVEEHCPRATTMVLPPSLLSDSAACWHCLLDPNPETWYGKILSQAAPV